MTNYDKKTWLLFLSTIPHLIIIPFMIFTITTGTNWFNPAVKPDIGFGLIAIVLSGLSLAKLYSLLWYRLK